MISIDDRNKSKEELLSELVAYKQHCAHLESLAQSQKITAEKLRRAEDILFNIVETVNSPLIVINEKRVLYMNNLFAKLLGKNNKDLLGLNPIEIFNDPADFSIQNPVEKSLRLRNLKFHGFLVSPIFHGEEKCLFFQKLS